MIERHIASVQRITSVIPVENADTLVKLQILGWQVVGKKGDFKPNDLCVFFEIDSILPDHPVFEFMRQRRFRVKTIKLRGELSQGLAMPLSIIGELADAVPTEINPDDLYEGVDLTEILGVKKREDVIKQTIQGSPRGNFPTHLVPKTDEIRIQQTPHIMEEFKGRMVYVTEKLDGTSGTYILADDFYVCSRNLALKEDDTNVYWRMARQYNLRDKLALIKSFTGRSYAIQGEIVGAGLQGNRNKRSDVGLYVFQIWDIDNRKFTDALDFIGLCYLLDLETVPFIHNGSELAYFMWEASSVDDWLKACEELTPMIRQIHDNPEYLHEGIVIRPAVECYSYNLRGRLSIKVINNSYLLNEK